MHLDIIEADQNRIAELIADEIVINSEQDALDIMAEASYYGASVLIVYQHNLPPEFFDLKTRLAGEIL